jgi:hypothetical protein
VQQLRKKKETSCRGHPTRMPEQPERENSRELAADGLPSLQTDIRT